MKTHPEIYVRPQGNFFIIWIKSSQIIYRNVEKNSFTMPPDKVYPQLQLKGSEFHKTSMCCFPSHTKVEKFRPIGGTFSSRPLTKRGVGGSDLMAKCT